MISFVLSRFLKPQTSNKKHTMLFRECSKFDIKSKLKEIDTDSKNDKTIDLYQVRLKKVMNMTVTDGTEKFETRLFMITYITVGSIITIYDISFKKQGLGHTEIQGPTLNSFFFWLFFQSIKQFLSRWHQTRELTFQTY